MARGLQIWPGEKMTAFFRTIIKRETVLDDAASSKLAEALSRPINRMLVHDITVAESPVVEPAVGKPVTAPPPKPNSPASAEIFDPYAFSAMVVLSKAGRGGLAKRLAEIKKSEHLHALADAQHLGVERSLKKADDIRQAIISATERRLANRKAAAS